jgi:hypothetical protein
MGDTAENPQFLAKTLPPSLYLQLLSLISTSTLCPPGTLFSVFTSVQSPGQRRMVQSFQRELEGLCGSQGVCARLYVDDEYTPGATADALDTIAHMASAEVLITARSTFSHVAAILNPHCVIFFPTSKRDVHLPHWIRLPLDRSAKLSAKTPEKERKVHEKEYLSIIERGLSACLSRATHES